MTRITSLAVLAVAAFSPLVSAGVEFISPKAGSDLTAGTSITVQWKEGGTGPKLTELTSYQLFLIAGGNKDEEQYVVKPITTAGLFTAGNAASSLIEDALSEDTKDNAYFIKMVAVAKEGGELTVYSDRFSYSGMKGKNILPAPVTKAISNLKGTSGPDTKDATGDKAAAGAGTKAPNAKLFDMAYTLQTGPTRYAPMQPVPPTKITATNTKPLYPTSSVKIAKSKLPIPSIVMTVTASQTFSVKSHENTVAAAPHATDDMAKFLRRWQD